MSNSGLRKSYDDDPLLFRFIALRVLSSSWNKTTELVGDIL